MAKSPVRGLDAAMLNPQPEANPRQVHLEDAIAAKAALKPQQPQAEGKPVNTTVKLEQALYLRLKAYCAQHRTNGQAVSVEALDAFLTGKGF